MNFDTEVKEIERKDLVPGEGTFEVINAEEKTSKAGNPMIELKLKVWDKEGNTRILSEYLVQKANWKIKNFLEACERKDLFEKGSLSENDCIGLSGECFLALEKGKEGFSDRVKIKYFVVPTEQESPIEDDDLPF